MTVQELIDKLQTIQDKSAKVYKDDEYYWDIFEVTSIRPTDEADDAKKGYVLINRP